MSASKFTKLGMTVATGLLLAPGCLVSEFHTGHCNYNDGDAYCAAQYPDGSRPYCEKGESPCISLDSENGCVPERPADECYSPCGGRSTVLENGECVMLEDSSSGSSSEGTDTEPSTGSSGESSSTTGPMPCVDDEECTDPEAPFCGTDGECGTCTDAPDPDAACASVNSMLPLCVGDACVACTEVNPVVCEEQLLLCDGTTSTCVPCSEHGQCPSGACELSVGRCFPEDFVVHVDGDAGAMPVPDYTSIAAAVAAVEGTHGVIVVHELDGAGSYQTAGMGLRIDAGKTIALLAAAGEAPLIQGTGGNPGLRVQGAGTILYIDGLRVSQATGLGVEVNQALAWLDRSHIVQNAGGGILAENDAELVLRNCFVGRNGDDFADTRGITATTATLDIRYTTIAGNDGTGATGPISLSCDGATSGAVRNSIVAAGDDTIACDNVSFSFNVVDTAGLMGTDNDVLSFDPAWFPNIAMSDLHVAMGPPFAGVAQWTTTDPPTDIDGDPRPTDDGDPDYAGADVPQ